mmetsp:Transcript_18158/g.28241  ORF Transcript_18158/g.28241 Transcript_18158/m.28241 type:complete len:332 (-) Transcript_18158:304-1299(-)
MNRIIYLRGASQKFSSFLTRQTLASTNIHHAFSRQCANAFSTASPLSLSAKIKELREATNAPMMECKKALTDPEVGGDIELAIEHLRRQGSAKASSKVAGREAKDGLVGLCISHDSSCGALVKVASETDFASRSSVFSNLVLAVANKAVEKEEVDVDTLTSDETVQKLFEEAILAIRENLSIAYVRSLKHTDGSILAGYVHGTTAPNVGTSAAMVELAWINGNEKDTEKAKEAGKKLAMHVVASRPQYLAPSDIPTEILEKEKAILMEQLADSGKPQEVLEKIIKGKLNKFYSEVCLEEQPHVVEEKSPKVSKVLKSLGLEVKRFEAVSIA